MCPPIPRDLGIRAGRTGEGAGPYGFHLLEYTP